MKRAVLTGAALAAAILPFLADTCPLGGQSSSPDHLASAATVQSQTNEVLLDLVVSDRHHHPVNNLLPEQLTVADNGTPVTLTRLSRIAGAQQDPPLVTLLFDRPAEQPATPATDDHFFSVTNPGKLLNDNAGKVLKNFPDSGFQWAVMDAWGRLQIQREFTSDRKAVNAAIAEAVKPGQYGVALTPTEAEMRLVRIAQNGQDATGHAAPTRDRALARALVNAMNVSSHVRKDQHLSTGLACLLALAQAQQSIPGRKAILYFTESKITYGSDRGKATSDSLSKEAIQAVIGAANRAGVSIYVIRTDDAQPSKEMAKMLNGFAATSFGVDTPDPSSYYASSSGGGGFAQLRNESMTSYGAFRMIASRQAEGANPDGLDELAKGTGGSAFGTAQNIAAPVKEMVRDLTTYYEASYTPPSSNEDGSFHAITVKPLRKGLNVRTRTGYLALPRSAGITTPPQAYELPLMALLNRAELPGEFGYHAAILSVGHIDSSSLNLVAVEVPLASLEVHQDGNTHLSLAQLSVLANIKDSSGAILERFSEEIPRRWSESENAADNSISFTRTFSAPPGEYTLETALLDQLGGKSAARRQSFRIGEETSYPELSEPILVRKAEPAEKGTEEFNPLLFGDRQIEPDLSGQLPAHGKRISVYLLAHTDPQRSDPAELKLEVLYNGEPIHGATLLSNLQDGKEMHPVMNSFSITSPAAGEYQLRATLTQAGKSAVSTTRLTMPDVPGANLIAANAGAVLVGAPPSLALAEQNTSQPAAEDLDRLLAEARKDALEYKESLPNLICQQSTNRFVSTRGDGIWNRRDTWNELLTYVDHNEKRMEIDKNGNASHAGILSAGEFGDALSGVFLPGAKASFTWKQSATLRGEPVEVFEYSITQANSTFSLRANLTSIMKAAYHGKIYIDRATHGVRSLTLIADQIPREFPLRQVAVRIDYDYVALGNHDLLLPVSAQVVASHDGRSLERNDLQFSNFRRYGSTARIVDTPAERLDNSAKP